MSRPLRVAVCLPQVPFEHGGAEIHAETLVDELRARHAEQDRDGAVAAISDRMIQAIDFIGSETEVAAFVRSYIDAGIEHPVLMPMPWGEDRFAVTRNTMVAAAAAFRNTSRPDGP